MSIPLILDGKQPSLPLDGYAANLKICISPLRRLLKSYKTGAAMELRRTSDNATQTFYFKKILGYAVDFAEITAFMGASTLNLVSLWDQSTGIKWSMATAGTQLRWDNVNKCFTKPQASPGSSHYVTGQGLYTFEYFLYRVQDAGVTEFYNYFASGGSSLISSQSGEIISASSSDYRWRMWNTGHTIAIVNASFVPDIISHPLNKYHWKHGTSQTNDFKLYENDVLKANSNYVPATFKTTMGIDQVRHGNTGGDVGNFRIRDWISYNTILSDADCTAILGIMGY
jgi:hypothetical protein